MIRSVPARAFLVLGLSVLAAPSFAARDGSFFDGAAAGPVPSVKALRLASARIPAPPAAAAPVVPAALRPLKQSGADLYYFSPAQAKAAAQRFGVERRTPASGALAFDSDVPAAIKTQMLEDLGFIKTIAGSGATPLHRRIFGAVDGPSYDAWFRSRVYSVGLNDCGSSKAVACVIPFEDPSKMWLTQNYIKFSHPQIARLMVVFHEARHTETQNGNWPHAYCPDPFQDANGDDMKSIWTGASLAGEPACDTTPFGSYGSSTIMLKNIQRFCTNCTDKVKMDAGLYADDQMGRITGADAKSQMLKDLYNR
jgi:hypothetical protein